MDYFPEEKLQFLKSEQVFPLFSAPLMLTEAIKNCCHKSKIYDAASFYESLKATTPNAKIQCQVQKL